MDDPLIVMVEDDAVIAELLEYNLKSNGYVVAGFRDGAQLFAKLPELADPALFILDLMLPGMDGYEICARLRTDPSAEAIPILMLTARSAESDKVRGLETGADDYLTKPFGMRELLARVQALIRRARRDYKNTFERPAGSAAAETNTASSSPDTVVLRSVRLDDLRHRVFKDGREIEMTHREYELLKHLMTHPGVAFSRDELLDAVWGYEYGGETRTVDVHIRQLRRKLERDDANPVLIETVRGRGYRFTDQP